MEHAVTEKKKRKRRTKEIALIGLFGGVSALLMLFKFPLPFMPPFMDFDFSGVSEIIGGFALGPMAAVLIILVKILIKIVFLGSSSALTGEIQNFMLSCAYVLPAVFIYYRNKSKQSAMIGMGVGTAVASIVAVFTNLYLIIPFYTKLMGLSLEQIIRMCQAVNPMMKDVLTFAILGIVPFNLIKNAVASFIACLVYKKISKQIHNIIQ